MFTLRYPVRINLVRSSTWGVLLWHPLVAITHQFCLDPEELLTKSLMSFFFEGPITPFYRNPSCLTNKYKHSFLIHRNNTYTGHCQILAIQGYFSCRPSITISQHPCSEEWYAVNLACFWPGIFLSSSPGDLLCTFDGILVISAIKRVGVVVARSLDRILLVATFYLLITFIGQY